MQVLSVRLRSPWAGRAALSEPRRWMINGALWLYGALWRGACARFVRRLLNSDYIIWSLSHGHSPVLAGMIVNSAAQAQVDNKGPCWFTEEAASVKNPQEQVAHLIFMFRMLKDVGFWIEVPSCLIYLVNRLCYLFTHTLFLRFQQQSVFLDIYKLPRPQKMLPSS